MTDNLVYLGQNSHLNHTKRKRSPVPSGTPPACKIVQLRLVMYIFTVTESFNRKFGKLRVRGCQSKWFFTKKKTKASSTLCISTPSTRKGSHAESKASHGPK